jgi:hypothetical protein
MGYKGVIGTLPFGRGGMVAHENRLLSVYTELLDAQGVTFEDRYARKEAGVLNFDAAGVANAPQFKGTLGFTPTFEQNWACAIRTFTCTATPTFTRVGGAIGSTNCLAARTFATVAAGHAIGSFYVVIAGLFASTAIPDIGGTNSGPNMVLTCADAKANVYTTYVNTFVTGSDNNTYAKIFMFVSKLATALVSGDIVTITPSPLQNVSMNVCSLEYSSTVNNTVDRSGQLGYGDTFQPISVDSGNPGALTALPELILAPAVSNFVTGSTQTLSVTLGFTQRTLQSNLGATSLFINDRIDTTAPTIIAIQDWHSKLRILSGAFTAATTQGSTTVTGAGGSLWSTGTEAQRIFNGDEIIVYSGTNQEVHTVTNVTNDTTLTVDSAFQTTFAATTYIIRRGPRLLTATTGGSVFKERNGVLTAVTLVSGLALSARPGKFIVCGKEDGSLNRKLIYLNGYDVPQGLVDDGATMAAISAPNADWDTTTTNAGARPHCGTVHRDRVVVACPNGKDPHRLYFSSAVNHGDFNTAATTNQRRVQSSTGDAIWNVASFNGVLWVWKHPVGIFYIDDSDLDITNWVERTVSQAIGCAPSPYAVCPMDDDIIFMTATGTFHVLSAVDTLGGVRASDLSWQLGLNKWLRENLNLARLGQVLSVWYPHKKLAMFAVPGVGSTNNNLLLKFDFGGIDYKEPVKFSYTFQNAPDAIALKRGTDYVWRPVIGETAFVQQLEQTARNKNNAAYTGAFQTPHFAFEWLDPKLARMTKLWEHLELVMEPIGATSVLTVQVYVDTILRQTLTFDGNKRRQRRKLNCGDGFNFSIKITNSLVNQDFKILAANVYFQPGDDMQQSSN